MKNTRGNRALGCRMTVSPDRVVAVIAESLGVDAETVATTDSLSDLGADAVDRYVLVMDLELAFHFAIPDGEAERCDTVGELVTLITSYAGRRSPDAPRPAATRTGGNGGAR